MVIADAQRKLHAIHIKKMPFAFTEQGIYMLATVLRGELAENTRQPQCTPEKEDAIMQAFRHFGII